MTPFEERDAQTVAMIRDEIAKAERHRANCGYAEGSMQDMCLRYEIQGMVTILSALDPDAMDLWPKSRPQRVA